MHAFDVLGDPVRRRILELLAEGELTSGAVCEVIQREYGISQPAVSKVIADLEHALGVRLFDRSSQGVEPTVFGAALLKRGTAAFDELKQGIRDIEFLADPGAGEVRIADQR